MPKHFYCLTLLILGLAALSGAHGDCWSQEPDTKPQQISKIADLMATPRAELANRTLVTVRGTVSAVTDGIAALSRNSAHSFFCIEDDTGGIYVRTFQSLNEKIFQGDPKILSRLAYGVSIELEGYVTQGGYAPLLLPTRFSILGKRKIEKPAPVQIRQFLSGAADMRRITVEGVVQGMINETKKRWLARIETGLGHFWVRLPKKPIYSPNRMLDAHVEVTGVSAASRNWRSQFVCPRVIVSRDEDIRVLTPARPDPFEAESVPMRNLDGYSTEGRPAHRRRVKGIVTFCDQGIIYLQDTDVGIRAQVNQSTGDIRVGDLVDVVGFIDNSRYLAGLRGALVRRIDRSEPPAPVAVTMESIKEAHQIWIQWEGGTTHSCDGQLIQLSGRLLSYQKGSGTSPHQLEIDLGNSISTAFLHGEGTLLKPGSEIRVNGVANVSYSSPAESVTLAEPMRVDLLLRSSDDITVLSLPSWWTTQRALLALGIVAALGLLSFFWAFMLRRTVTQQTDLLAMEIRNRRDAAIEFQGAIRERTRLAANLHDTLLQTMAGISYQLHACMPSKDDARPEIVRHLETAERMVERGQDDLRNTVWALHCLPLHEGTFADSLRQVTKQLGKGQDTTISVSCPAKLPALADFIAGNLLLAIQEAIHNALKHADAESIEVVLRISGEHDRLNLEVTDNGKGFDETKRPTSKDGHFGIEGMQQRIERIGGNFSILSQTGKGTTIKADLPLHRFDPIIE